ncbi:spermatogenesis-associated protein 6 isoform X1 [Bombyx mandarina]|uniref:Spermatogenesis-associated protein 6 isoform X1 n=2 Tax=Bombyx mandarina TaxID=7092 RepID=A0A6J2KPV5_BOMMA|nr:spermatogenesis-associated protein 6 isoform X1 [Bombyx mandarina]
MPKIIELTVEIEIQRVSCPGVWLCQDGRVSLSVYALGTSYQTCMLPPIFPLTFKDVFYFRKRFQETCALNNICCLLKDETIYCELVQWSEDCVSNECTILAQYLGALNDVLFPPNMCSNDGVDLLMRRSKDFPGILSPKIEIATKVRIDEVWNQSCLGHFKQTPCHCDNDSSRQKTVCHSAKYHRKKCGTSPGKRSASRSRSRSRSGGSRSCCSLTPVAAELNSTCRCPNPMSKSRTSVSRGRAARGARPAPFSVYSVAQVTRDRDVRRDDCDQTERTHSETDNISSDRIQKLILESRYIDLEPCKSTRRETFSKTNVAGKLTPCVCEICRRYHELFHSEGSLKS